MISLQKMLNWCRMVDIIVKNYNLIIESGGMSPYERYYER